MRLCPRRTLNYGRPSGRGAPLQHAGATNESHATLLPYWRLQARARISRAGAVSAMVDEVHDNCQSPTSVPHALPRTPSPNPGLVRQPLPPPARSLDTRLHRSLSDGSQVLHALSQSAVMLSEANLPDHQLWRLFCSPLGSTSVTLYARSAAARCTPRTGSRTARRPRVRQGTRDLCLGAASLIATSNFLQGKPKETHITQDESLYCLHRVHFRRFSARLARDQHPAGLHA